MTSSYEMDTLTHTVYSGLRRNIVRQLFQDSFEEAFEPPIYLHGVVIHKVTVKDASQPKNVRSHRTILMKHVQI
jgi:hypothetical protein